MPATALPTKPAFTRLIADDRKVEYADDRAYHELQNRREFEQKLAKGLIRRRPQGAA